MIATILGIACALLALALASALRSRSWWRTIAREAQEQIVADSRKIREQAEMIHRLEAEARSDAASIAEAYALLHDDGRKARTGRKALWITKRDEWARKGRGEL